MFVLLPLTATYVTFSSTPWNWFQHPRLRNINIDLQEKVLTTRIKMCLYHLNLDHQISTHYLASGALLNKKLIFTPLLILICISPDGFQNDLPKTKKFLQKKDL